jgi:CRP/FNR family transcriptional regulator, cyclic AMP receptor protein
MSAEDRGALSIERQLFLRSWAIARPLAGSIPHIASLMRDVYYPAGAIIYREGGAPEEVFFIVRGDVHLIADRQEPFKFKDRSVVGILDMLQDRPHARTAVAISDVHALVIRGDDWIEMLEDNSDYARAAIVNQAAGMLDLTADLPTAGFASVDGDWHEPRGPESRTSTSAEPLDLVGKLLVLRATRAFSMARIQALTSMAEAAEDVRFAAGEAVFTEGQLPTSTYVVARGRVALEGQRLRAPVTFGPGALLGGYAGLSARPRPFTARAEVASTLLAVRNEELLDVMEVHFEVARSLMAFIATERIRIMTQRAELAAAVAPASVDVVPTVPLPVGA